MKLKKWIILSYVIIMTIPSLIVLCVYYVAVDYYKGMDLFEYLSVTSKIESIEKRIGYADIYRKPPKKLKILHKNEKKNVYVDLYNKYGLPIFSTYEDLTDKTNLSREELYTGVYELKVGFGSYSIKKPVFYKNKIVGFYTIRLIKSKSVNGINLRSGGIYGLFFIIFITVLIISSRIVESRINRPIHLLINSMKSFEEENEDYEIHYSKGDEIGELIKQYEHMKTEILAAREEKLRRQKEKEYMISAISHDLKSPLTSIRAYAESIEKYSQLNEAQRVEYAQTIQSKSDYMTRLIDDLLCYSLISTQDYKMDFVTVEGQEFFEMLFSGYDEICSNNSMELYSEVKVKGSYNVDVKHMIRLVDNLIVNAVRYADINTTVWIGAYSKDSDLPEWLGSYRAQIEDFRADGTVILIKNYGRAVPKEEREKIFRPLYRSGNVNNMTAYNGVGLGLSIVKMIIEKHSGKIRVLSEESSGTLFACFIQPMEA